MTPPRLIAALGGLLLLSVPAWAGATLLNASYDPTSELYRDYNAAFIRHWRAETGQSVRILQSHGGSGRQALAVMEGLPADVVTLAEPRDIDAVAARTGLIAADWRRRFPDGAAPYSSTVVFLVRRGNPRHIRDWSDLARPGVVVMSASPKTSGGARWAYLAAWGYALRRSGGDDGRAQGFMRAWLSHVPVWESGARGATAAFLRRGVGDVLLTWENEAMLARREAGGVAVEIIYPSCSILAEPPVAVVDGLAARHGTSALAEAYLRHLYSPEGQEIVARNHYRPRDAAALRAHAADFPAVTLFTVASLGGWAALWRRHFAEGGLFDRLTAAER
ncbi:sulfate-binding protein precursor [mine drainage metagenome]|uniref:Sulfate-binding protein n=1 Tax=mine drainage metagenome TaxID=410659 RepID=A0A1J5QWM8_9ZZZZ